MKSVAASIFFTAILLLSSLASAQYEDAASELEFNAEMDKKRIKFLSDEEKVKSLNSALEANTVSREILQGLKKARPDLEFSQPKPSLIAGYYEASISGGQTVYVSADGKHFFSGELYFAEPGRFVNATEMARTKDRLNKLASLDASEMIIFSPKGETKASMTVFTDVTCGYCRKLHNQMAEMNDLGIEVRYMAYPRSGIKRDGAYTREYIATAKAWCADDRKSAMDTLKSGGNISGEVCDEPIVSKHYQIGTQFGVSGTPAIILPDGSLLPGYRTPKDYARILGIRGDS